MDIIEVFYEHRHEENALPMAKYMKNQFPFLGLKKPERTKLSRPFLREKKKEPHVDWEFIKTCYGLPEREFHYLAIDYLEAMQTKLTPSDMPKIEEMIVT